MNMVEEVTQSGLPFGLSLGGGPLGNLFSAIDDDVATSTLDAAWNAGIRYFDTAPHYGLGLSERRMGGYLSQKPREEFTISTKVGRRLVERSVSEDHDDEGFDVLKTHDRVIDYTERGLRQSLEDSLIRLGLDSVDIVYLHDPEFALAEAFGTGGAALERMRSEGLCRLIGVGSNEPDVIAAMVERFDLDVVMAAGSLTLLDQSGLTDMIPACRAKDVDVVAAGVFNSGILAVDDPAQGHFSYERPSTSVIERVTLLRTICTAYGLPLRAVAMAFPTRYGSVASVCIGAQTPDEVASNVADWAIDIPDELWHELESLALVDVVEHEQELSITTTNGSIQT